MIVYSTKHLCVTTIDLSAYWFDDKGFEIYITASDGRRLYLVTKSHIVQVGLQVKDKIVLHSLRHIAIEARKNDISTHCEIIKDKIITISRKETRYEPKLRLRYQELPAIISVFNTKMLVKIGTPEQIKNIENIKFLQTKLPAQTALCHIDCPHCHYRTTEQNKNMLNVRDPETDHCFDNELFFDFSTGDDDW